MPPERAQITTHTPRSSPLPDTGGASGVAARFEELVRAQHALFVELEAAAICQGELIESEAMDELLAHFDAREQLVARIVKTSAELEPFRARWESLLSQVPAPLAGELRGLLDDTADRARRIHEIDEAHRVRLGQRREDLSAELAGVDRGRVAVDAYGGVVPAAAPRFQDRHA